ncbi:MAG: amidase [Pseudonocardiales bacterium]|nr:amidase [Pseudonocardiales bacterium]
MTAQQVARSEAPTALFNLTVTEAAASIAAGDLSVLDYNMAFIERTDELEPHIHAFAYLDRDGWIAEAVTLDAEAKAGRLRGPLHGIPVGIKDQFFVKGMPSVISRSWGVEYVPTQDATLVARLRDAGAIIAGTTYMPDRNGDPPSCNPWNLDHTPGGSSSGSSAVVGARMLPVSIGESTGGSGIRPPSFCGVAAMKPTFGRISGKGMYVISWSLDHPTVIGQTMADIALVYNSIAGPDPLDETGREEPFEPVSAEVPARPPRIGWIKNYFPDLCEPVMLQQMESAVATLRAGGADIVDIELPEGWDAVWPVFKVVAGAERTTYHSKHAGDLLTEGVDVTPVVEEFIPAPYYLEAQRVRRWLLDGVMPLFDQVDFLLTPAAIEEPPLGHGTGDNRMNSPWAVVGIPSLTFNIGLSPNGLPMGAQLAAPQLQEDAILKAGAWCESVLGLLGTPHVEIPEGVSST